MGTCVDFLDSGFKTETCRTQNHLVVGRTLVQSVNTDSQNQPVNALNEINLTCSDIQTTHITTFYGKIQFLCVTSGGTQTAAPLTCTKRSNVFSTAKDFLAVKLRTN
jgi:hypothetical protein